MRGPYPGELRVRGGRRRPDVRRPTSSTSGQLRDQVGATLPRRRDFRANAPRREQIAIGEVLGADARPHS